MNFKIYLTEIGYFHSEIMIVGEMNLSKSGEFEVTSFLSLWHMRCRVL